MLSFHVTSWGVEAGWEATESRKRREAIGKHVAMRKKAGYKHLIYRIS